MKSIFNQQALFIVMKFKRKKKRQLFSFNSKGFNMFSALVAAVLLMTSVVLVSILVNTEERLGRELYIMIGNYKLSDAAALARADALQSFNFHFREQMENYLTYDTYERDNQQGFTLIRTEDLASFNWSDVEAEFERTILLVDDAGGATKDFDAAIDFVARKTVTQFKGGRYGRYKVELSDTSEDSIRAIKDGINQAMVTYMDEGNRVLEVLDCDDMDCPLGTFYFNIPLDKLDPVAYDALPRIVVQDVVTKEELQIAILPKTRLRIYIPLRFFKAIYEAKKNAEVIDFVEGRGDISKARLGFCDAGSCYPRDDPLRYLGISNWTQACVGLRDTDVEQSLPVSMGINSYLTKSSSIGQIALGAFIKEKICAKAQSLGDVHDTDDSEFVNYNNDGSGNPIGLRRNENEKDDIADCPFFNISVIPDSKKQKLLVGGVAGTNALYCTKVRRVYADVLYKETNKLYIVNGTENYYKIRIAGRANTPLIERNETCNNNNSGAGSSGTCKV
jgi:hypothetical protein